MDLPDAPSDRKSESGQPILNATDVFSEDRRSLRARKKKKSGLSCGRLCIIFGSLVVLCVVGCIAFLIFIGIKSFWSGLTNPHQYAVANTGPLVIKSYYGKRVPKFDVVASVYVRFGRKLGPVGPTSEEVQNVTPASLGPYYTNETEQFGEWQSLYSQPVFSNVDLNSTEKVFRKTVDLAIPKDVLSRFYEPHTYFPQIINTFVVVPSSLDPIFDPSSSGSLATFNLSDFAYPDPNPTTWSRSPLRKLCRPFEYDHTNKHSSWLDAFYDATAVREFALRPVRDQWTSFNPQNSSMKSNQTISLPQVGLLMDDPEERKGLRVKRNATIKIKTRSHLSMAREIPDYDVLQFMSGRDAAAKKHLLQTSDPLNKLSPSIDHPLFSSLGHFQSYLLHSPEEHEGAESGSFFYGPYLSLQSSAAGGHDWVTLPRMDESSDDQSDPLTVPWHITFDLLSNEKLGLISMIEQMFEVEEPMDEDPPTAAAYAEANLLENADFISSLLGNNPTSPRRSILRTAAIFLGSTIYYPVAGLLQLHYLYTRSTSTGISMPPIFLDMALGFMFTILRHVLPPPGSDNASIWGDLSSIAINSSVLWPRIILWFGIEFIWGSLFGISAPIGFKRFRPTHSERTSRRVDQQFTWIQKSLCVALMAIFYYFLPHIPHLIASPVYLFPSEIELSVSSVHSDSSPLSRMLGDGLETYGMSLMNATSFMANLSQVVLNHRLGTFAGSYALFAWAAVIGTVLTWLPVVVHSVFGKFETSAPLDYSTVAIFAIDVVLLWQAVTLPKVNQEEEPDE